MDQKQSVQKSWNFLPSKDNYGLFIAFFKNCNFHICKY